MKNFSIFKNYSDFVTLLFQRQTELKQVFNKGFLYLAEVKNNKDKIGKKITLRGIASIGSVYTLLTLTKNHIGFY